MISEVTLSKIDALSLADKTSLFQDILFDIQDWVTEIDLSDNEGISFQEKLVSLMEKDPEILEAFLGVPDLDDYLNDRLIDDGFIDEAD